MVVNLILGEDIVPAMTIHKSKGLEFETVIFWGLRIINGGISESNLKKKSVHFLSPSLAQKAEFFSPYQTYVIQVLTETPKSERMESCQN